MKITIDIDCTPQEARAFFGWPDLEPLHQAATRELLQEMTTTLASMEPEALPKAWLSSGLQGVERMQSLWAELAAAGKGRGA